MIIEDNMKRNNTSEFIDDAKQMHGNKYSYELVEYKDRITKVKIICPDHGVFEQKPCNHLNKCGCPECGKNTLSQKMSLTTQLFITKAKQVHGDKYDYSLVEYKTANTKVKIICPIHGVFEQRPFAQIHKGLVVLYVLKPYQTKRLNLSVISSRYMMVRLLLIPDRLYHHMS